MTSETGVSGAEQAFQKQVSYDETFLQVSGWPRVTQGHSAGLEVSLHLFRPSGWEDPVVTSAPSSVTGRFPVRRASAEQSTGAGVQPHQHWTSVWKSLELTRNRFQHLGSECCKCTAELQLDCSPGPQA